MASPTTREHWFHDFTHSIVSATISSLVTLLKKCLWKSLQKSSKQSYLKRQRVLEPIALQNNFCRFTASWLSAYFGKNHTTFYTCN